MTDRQPRPGWYPGPDGPPGLEQYWDGSAWTEQRRISIKVPAAPPTAAPEQTISTTDWPPAGWYSDPWRPEAERYWDGGEWTDDLRPAYPVVERESVGRGRGPFFSWVARKPALAFWLTLVVSALVGAGIGAATGVDRGVHDDLNTAVEELNTANAAKEQAESELSNAQSKIGTLSTQIKGLTADGKVPDFAGMTLSEAQDLAGAYGWNLDSTTAQSDNPEGTVIAQSVDPGTVLDRGESITVTVAAPSPNK